MNDGSITTSTRNKQLFIEDTADVNSFFRNMLTKHCHSCEKIAPDSSRLLLQLLQRSLSSTNKVSWNSLAFSQELFSTRISKDTIVTQLLDSFSEAGKTLAVALDMAGAECKIRVEPGTVLQPTVEQINGHTFRCEPNPFFFNEKSWKSSDVKIFLVDGVIDKLSEIDVLLQECHKQNQSLALVARGFHESVTATLVANFAKQTLNVIPVVVAFDIETANVLLDMSIVLGCHVKSSLTGDVIFTTRLDELPLAKSVICSSQSMTIHTYSDQTQRVAKHQQSLIERRQREANESMVKVLDQRIRSLVSSEVIIRVDDRGVDGNERLHELDASLRFLRGMIRGGFITRDNIAKLTQDPIEKDILLNVFSKQEYPSFLVKTVLSSCKNLCQMFDSLGGAII
jgi:hypothetical protein